MASIRSVNGRLFCDFRYQGKRHREFTGLLDNAANRKLLEKKLVLLEQDIALGQVDLARYFGQEALVPIAALLSPPVLQQVAPTTLLPVTATKPSVLFTDFAERWFQENAVTWRFSYRETVNGILRKYLIPTFGEYDAAGISRETLLGFRAKLGQCNGRRKTALLSPARINTIMLILCQCLNEAADRFGFQSPCYRIKPLKVPRTDIQPFTLEEVKLILDNVRADYRNYFTVRFFTGMRTGEIDGLKWSCVDFERRLILVRTTIVRGREDTTKTDSSIRDIRMSGVVYGALQRQHAASHKLSAYVFCNLAGQPVEQNNVTKRVWYPLLRHLGLTLRRPYQSRHTAATLWLAAGENPEWIARQLGHSNTEMLFSTYSRYIPNLTRQDGSAFEQLLESRLKVAAG